MRRVFFDANVLIAGVASHRGASRAALMMAEAGLFQMVVSRQVLDEAERNLRRKLPVVLSNGVATVNFTVSSRLAAGDIAPATRDNKVNTLDRNVLLSQWGKPAPGNAAADLNGDGLVNTIDRNRLLSNWGTEGAAP